MHAQTQECEEGRTRRSKELHGIGIDAVLDIGPDIASHVVDKRLRRLHHRPSQHHSDVIVLHINLSQRIALCNVALDLSKVVEALTECLPRMSAKLRNIERKHAFLDSAYSSMISVQRSAIPTLIAAKVNRSICR